MPQSYDRIVVQTTFSTKYRQAIIDDIIGPQVSAVMIAEVQKLGVQVIEIGGTKDHVHILHNIPRTRTIAEIVNAMKSVSSKWIKTKGEPYAWFEWQDGYGCFSADYRNLDNLIHYVRRQKEHHGVRDQKMTFQEEYTRYLQAFGFSDFKVEYQFPEKPDHGFCHDPLPLPF
jgi:REP element-mobilizing transposase RayT